MNLILISITKFSLWHSFVSEFLCVFGHVMQVWFSPFCPCLVLACTSAGNKAVDGELRTLVRTSGSYERFRLAVGSNARWWERNTHSNRKCTRSPQRWQTSSSACCLYVPSTPAHTHMQTDGSSGHWHSSLFPTLTNIIYHPQQPLCCVCVLTVWPDPVPP